jgi:alpha-beta hydrolase superfamily lysophospholipase
VTREQQFDLPAARLLPLLLLLLILAGCGGGNGAANPVAGKTRGEVIRYRQVAAYNKGQINAALTFAGQRDLTPVPYAVTVYEVVYATPNVRGKMSQASGMVAVPEAPAGAARPLVAYFHGTQTLRTDVPSNPKNAEGQGTAFLFAAAGYIVACPDYLGLGQSPGQQTFEQAAPLATGNVDMLRAARRVAETLSIGLNGQLFLCGYSQGGYATLATQRALEADYASEFSVTASAPMAGPYDLSGTTFEAVFDPDTAAQTSLPIAGILLAYNESYDLYQNPSEVFAAPYDARVAGLFDGTHAAEAVSAGLPSSAAALLRPDFAVAVRADPNHPLRAALRANDVYDFRPLAPVRLFHGKADRNVPFANAEVAQRRMTERGGAVELVNVGDALDHETAVIPSFVGARRFFDTFVR